MAEPAPIRCRRPGTMCAFLAVTADGLKHTTLSSQGKPGPDGAPSVGPAHVDWRPAGSHAVQCLAGFLRVREFDVRDVARFPDTFDEIRNGQLNAAIVHGVLDGATIAALLEAVRHAGPSMPRSSFPAAFRSGFYGRNLNLCHPDLTRYFDEASVFNRQLAALPPGPAGLISTLTGLLATLDRGSPFDAAPGPAPPQRYMFTTLREHRPGGFIPPHFDNEMRLRPSYRHLAGIVEHDLLSFVLALTLAEAGGALELFDIACDPGDARLLSDDRTRHRIDTSGRASVRFRLPPGSLIVVDSGRFLHQLTPVEGTISRWTVRSFMGRDLTRPTTYCWG